MIHVFDLSILFDAPAASFPPHFNRDKTESRIVAATSLSSLEHQVFYVSAAVVPSPPSPHPLCADRVRDHPVRLDAFPLLSHTLQNVLGPARARTFNSLGICWASPIGCLLVRKYHRCVSPTTSCVCVFFSRECVCVLVCVRTDGQTGVVQVAQGSLCWGRVGTKMRCLGMVNSHANKARGNTKHESQSKACYAHGNANGNLCVRVCVFMRLSCSSPRQTG